MDEAVKLAILLAAKDVGSSVVKGFGNTLHGLGHAGDVAKLALGGVVVAGAGVVAASLSFAKAAADEQVGVDRLHQAIKNVSGGRLKDVAAVEKQIRAGELLAFSDDEQRAALSVLINETGSLAEARKRLSIAENFARGAQIDLGTASKLLGKITDENVRVLGRYGIVVKKGSTETQLLQEVQKRFGGQAASFAKGATAQWQIFKNEMANIREDIGGFLLPIFTRFGTVAHEAATKVRDVLADPKIASAIEVILQRVGALAQGFADVAGKALGFAGDIALKVAPLVGAGFDVVGRVFAAVKQKIGDVVRAVQDFQRFLKVGDNATALFAFLTDLGVNFKTAGGLADAFNTVLKTVKGVVADAKTSFQELLDLMSKGDWKEVGSRLGHALVDGAKVAIAGIVGLGKVIVDTLAKVDWHEVGKQVANVAIPLAVGFILGLGDAIINEAIHHPFMFAAAILTVFFTPARFIIKLAEVLAHIPIVGPLLGWILRGVKGLVDAALGPIANALRAVGGAVARGFESATRDGIGDGMARAVPTIREMIGEVFGGIGNWIRGHVLGIAEGLGRWLGEWGVRIRDAIGRIPGILGNLGRLLWQAGIELVQGLLGAAERKWVEVIDFFGGIRQKVANAVGDLGRTLWNAGWNLIQGLWDGATSRAGAFLGWLGSLKDEIAKRKGPIAADRQLLVKQGEAIMQGLRTGLRTGWRDTERLVAGMGGGLRTGMAMAAPSAAFGQSPTPAAAGGASLDTRETNSLLRAQNGLLRQQNSILAGIAGSRSTVGPLSASRRTGS